MSRIAVLLMPWGRVGSNLVNSVVQKSGACTVWNEPLTRVMTQVTRAGGSVAEIWPAQLQWMRENIGKGDAYIFFNIAADSVGDAAAFREYMAQFSPRYIVLDRQDDLATAVSALRTRAWVREGAAKGEARNWSIPSGLEVAFRPTIDPANLKAAFSHIRKGRRNIATITEGAGAKVFTYEDLLADMKGVVTEILAAAGIPAYDFKVTSGKFGSKTLSDMVGNADDLMRVAVESGVATELSA